MTGPASSLTETVTSLAFRPLLIVADEAGVGAEARAAAGPLPDPASLEAHLPVARWFAVFELLEAAMPGRAVAVETASRTKLSDLEVFGFLAMTASSLGEAFERVGRARALWARGSGWRLDEHEGGARLSLRPFTARRRGAELAVEHLLGEMIGSVREIVGEAVNPVEVCFAHSSSGATEAYAARFGVSPRFGAGESALRFPSTMARLPVRAFDTRLHAYFVEQCDALIAAAPDDELGFARRWIAEAWTQGPPGVRSLAKAMGVSERTLRRRLELAGTSFKELREEVAVELANAHLRRPGLTASEVAFVLGFSEPSAFFRAYRRWTGETPRAYQSRTRDRSA